MKTLKLVLPCVFVLLCCFACSSPPSERTNEEAANHTGDAKSNKATPTAEVKPVSQVDTKTIYNDKCAVCHGEDGKGVTKGTPNFTDSKWQKKFSDGQFAVTIKNGKNTMPGFADKLDSEQMYILVGYVRNFAK